MRFLFVYLYTIQNTHELPNTIPQVVPQNPITLISSVLLKFIPNIEATIAPRAAANEAMERSNSRRLTSNRRADKETPMDSSKSRAPASNLSASDCCYYRMKKKNEINKKNSPSLKILKLKNLPE